MSTQKNRLDDADQYFLDRQLEKLQDPTKFYALVPGIVGRKFLPLANNVNAAQDSYEYDMTAIVGATTKTGRGRNIPTVEIKTTKHMSRIVPIKTSATWLIDDVQKARIIGHDISGEKMQAAVTFVEQQFDRLLAVGDAAAGVYGLANHPGVADVAATAAWSGATPAQIVGDIKRLVGDANTALGQGDIPGSDSVPKFDQWVLCLPNKYRTVLSFDRLDATLDSTIGKFLRENEQIKGVRWWHRLDTANGGNPMAVLAPALDNGAVNPMAGKAIISLDFQALPEQISGFDVIVPCQGKCGGFVMPYPVAFRYLKGM